MGHYSLPQGWTWRDVVRSRVKYGHREDFYPLAVVPGICVAWGKVIDANIDDTQDIARSRMPFMFKPFRGAAR